MNLMNLSPRNRIDEINLEKVDGKVIIGSDDEGVYFLGGNFSDHYTGMRDFPYFVKKFGLMTALQSDARLFTKKINPTNQDKKKVIIYTH